MTGSTNSDAAELAKEGAAHGTVVIADRQEKGRGSRGRSWETPGGENIAMSLVIRPTVSPESISMLTLVMGLSVAEGVDEALFETLKDEGENSFSGDKGVRAGEVPEMFCRIKWPNDIVIDRRKICGILTELHMNPDNTISDVITGVGINVNMVDFPDEIKDMAGSLLTQTGIRTDRSLVVAKCLERFEANFEKFEKTHDLSLLKERYESRLININETVRVLDPKGEFEGRAHGITDRGALLVETSDGIEHVINAGEVSVRGLYGYV